MALRDEFIEWKPCLAFDALCALAHSKYFIRTGDEFIRDWLGKICEGSDLPNSVSQLSEVLVKSLSSSEIECLTVKDLCSSYPEMLRVSAETLQTYTKPHIKKTRFWIKPIGI